MHAPHARAAHPAAETQLAAAHTCVGRRHAALGAHHKTSRTQLQRGLERPVSAGSAPRRTQRSTECITPLGLTWRTCAAVCGGGR